MKLILSIVLSILLVQVSAEANSKVGQDKIKKVQNLEVKLESLYEQLYSKTQEVLPPLKKLNVSNMKVHELVEVQKILAPFYALDNKLSSYRPKLRASSKKQSLNNLEKELGHLESVIKNL